MRTIEEVVEEIKSIYPNYINPIKGDDDNKRLYDRLNEIIEIHKAEKRPRGKWITIELDEENEERDIKVDENGCVNDRVKCSACGSELAGSGEYLASGNFCPNCGADMRESEGKE